MIFSFVFIKSLDHCSVGESEKACDDLTLLLLDTISEVLSAIKGELFLLSCKCFGIRRGSGGLLKLHLAVRFSVCEIADTGSENGDPIHWNDVALSPFPGSLAPIGKVALAGALEAVEAVVELESESAE